MRESIRGLLSESEGAPRFQNLAYWDSVKQGIQSPDSIDAVQTLPLRVMLDTCGLPFSEEDLADLAIDLNRQFSRRGHLVFGGSANICMGKKLGIEFVKSMMAGFVENLPEDARVLEDEVQADGSWVAERIIKKVPIAMGASAE